MFMCSEYRKNRFDIVHRCPSATVDRAVTPESLEFVASPGAQLSEFSSIWKEDDGQDDVQSRIMNPPQGGEY